MTERKVQLIVDFAPEVIMVIASYMLSTLEKMQTQGVRVESREDVATASRPRIGEELAALIKKRVGVTAHVDVVDPHALERSTGKAKRIVDLRDDR